MKDEFDAFLECGILAHGFLTDGVMIEWLKSRIDVTYQPLVGHKA